MKGVNSSFSLAMAPGVSRQVMVYGVQLLLWLWLAMVLLEPVGRIAAYQRYAVLWLVGWVTLVQAFRGEAWTEEKFCTDYELERQGGFALGVLWRWRLRGMGIANVGVYAVVMIWWCIWGGVEVQGIVLWWGMWSVQMPIYLLCVYLLHLIVMRSALSGLWLSVVLLPWVLPSGLWMLQAMYALERGLEVAPYLCFQLSWALVGGLCLPKVLDRVREWTYLRLKLTG